jgi:hypothetical protein
MGGSFTVLTVKSNVSRNVTQDLGNRFRDQRLALVTMIMNLQVPLFELLD